MLGRTQIRGQLRLFAWFCVLFGLLLGTVEIVSPRKAYAQADPQFAVNIQTVTDLNGEFDVVISVLPGTTPVGGGEFSFTYDPALIQPVLVGPGEPGIEDSVACTTLNGGAGSCGVGDSE